MSYLHGSCVGVGDGDGDGNGVGDGDGDGDSIMKITNIHGRMAWKGKKRDRKLGVALTDWTLKHGGRII